MKKLKLLTKWYLFFIFFVVLAACSEDEESDYNDINPSNNANTNDNIEAGQMTAGEWNDLENWDFWQQIIQKNENKMQLSYWHIKPTNRISVQVINENTKIPVINAKVELVNQYRKTKWTAITDNQGLAELWIDIYQKDYSDYRVKVQYGTDLVHWIDSLSPYENDPLKIMVNNETTTENINNVDVMFVIDATGSMGDEINYLKTELKDVIQKAMNESHLNIRTGTVFYRDKDDEYLTRSYDFEPASNINRVIENIDNQIAGGGGDFPEAVEAGLEEAIDQNWNTNAISRLLFLILDAPPHNNNETIIKIQELTKSFAEKGVKIIPITASGIDKDTEFLMRFIAIATNGTYVFITDDSGIGNDHLEPTVGDYDVEYLNDLLIRLIKKYSEIPQNI